MKGAAELIGAPIEAGSPVTAKGRAKAVMTGAAAGQLLGSVAKAGAEMVQERRGGGASPLPAKSWSLGYLALTADALILLEAKNGLLAPKAIGELARAPRSAVATTELGDGKLQSPLSITFDDGQVWEFEIPRVQVKKTRAILDALA